MGESGGIATKLGHTYEKHWSVRQLCRLLEERIGSVQIEPLGDDEKGVDLKITHQGKSYFQQCKKANVNNDRWSISDFNQRNILAKLKEQVERSENNYYEFVSGVPFEIFKSICDIANYSDGNPKNFYEYQIKSNQQRTKVFQDFCSMLSLDITNGDEEIRKRALILAYNYFRKSSFILFQDNKFSQEETLYRIEYLMTGDPDSNYDSLLEFVENNYRKIIYADELWRYLENKNILPEKLIDCPRVSNVFRDLQRRFNDSIESTLICQELIKRDESQKVIDELNQGNSVIIHGAAGTGKSGVLLEVVKYLESENIPHLGIRLDRTTMSGCAKTWGISLGLPGAPEICLNKIAGVRKSVLILDQLDAIRWTSTHSTEVLDICKEIVKSILSMQREKEKISIIIACRSFDLKNDPEIKNWLAPRNEQSTQKFGDFKRIEVKGFSEGIIKKYTKQEFKKLSGKQINLLQNPLCLYIWNELFTAGHAVLMNSRADLLRKYINNIKGKIEKTGISQDAINDVIDTLMAHLRNNNKVFAHESILDRCSTRAKEALLSYGILKEHGCEVGFPHQSFSDFMTAQKIFDDIREDFSVVNWLIDGGDQTLVKREQLRLVLELIAEVQTDSLTCEIKKILESDIRFHLKHLCLEFLGELTSVDKGLFNYMYSLWQDKDWYEHILYSVFNRNTCWFEKLFTYGYIKEWLQSKDDVRFNNAIYLIRINPNSLQPDVAELLLTLYDSFTNSQKTLLLNLMYHSSDFDNEKMFDLQMKLAADEIFPDYFDWERSCEHFPHRAIKLLETELQYVIDLNTNNDFILKSHYKDFNRESLEKLIQAAGNQYELTWNSFLCKLEKIPREMIHRWLAVYSNRNREDIANVILKMTIAAGKAFAKDNPERFLQSIVYIKNENMVVRKIIAMALTELPTMLANEGIGWLLKGDNRLSTSYHYHYDEFSHAVGLIKALSPHCSNELFTKLETTIYYFRDNDKKWALSCIRHNREKTVIFINRQGEIVSSDFLFWGKCQHKLLPVLDSNRISKGTKNLIKVLARKYKFYSEDVSSTGGTVVSPVASHLDKISDKAWLNIVTNKRIADNRVKPWKQLTPETISEASISTFSHSLRDAASNDPERFCELALKFPVDINDDYLSSIFDAAAILEPNANLSPETKDSWRPAPITIIQELFFKFKDKIKSRSCVKSFCWMVEKRAKDSWADEILKQIGIWGTTHNDPVPGELCVSNSEEKTPSLETLFTCSLNCARGIAVRAMGRLLWHHKDAYKLFLPYMDKIINDEHVSVRMAALEILLPLLNIDKDQAVGFYIKLCSQDILVSACQRSLTFLDYTIMSHKKLVEPLLIKLIKSPQDEIAKEGVKRMTAYWIFHDFFDEYINSFVVGSKTKRFAVAEVIATLFWNEKYIEKCKKLAILLFNDDEVSIRKKLSEIFWRGKSEIIELSPEDSFLKDFIGSKMFGEDSSQYFEFLANNIKNKDLIRYVDLVIESSNKYIDSFKLKNENYQIDRSLEFLLVIILKIYEQAQNKNSTITNQCLDIFDAFYFNRIEGIHKLSQEI